jgi:hypothetical protein
MDAPLAARTHAALSRTQAPYHRTPLMRFLSLQHTLAATRCPRQPAPDDPASAFNRGLASRAVAEHHEPTRPCGFSLAANAMRPGLNVGDASALSRCIQRSGLSGGCTSFVDRRVREMLAKPAVCAHRRSVTSSAAASCLPFEHRSCTNAFPQRGVPLPADSNLRGLAGRFAPSLKTARRRSWGSGLPMPDSSTKTGFF